MVVSLELLEDHSRFHSTDSHYAGLPALNLHETKQEKKVINRLAHAAIYRDWHMQPFTLKRQFSHMILFDSKNTLLHLTRVNNI